MISRELSLSAKILPCREELRGPDVDRCTPIADLGKTPAWTQEETDSPASPAPVLVLG